MRKPGLERQPDDHETQWLPLSRGVASLEGGLIDLFKATRPEPSRSYITKFSQVRNLTLTPMYLS
ncbi:hypothetical protein EMIT0P253_60074 [Pseudomonas sp. IT-P253]